MMVSLPALAALLMLISASQTLHVEAGLWSPGREPPTFSAVPAHIASKGQGQYLLSAEDRCLLLPFNLDQASDAVTTAGSLKELQTQASGESFVSKLLGTDCFTNSLSIVNNDCQSLDSERKSRLAMALAICHLKQLGQPTFTCRPSMSLKECADSMTTERQYMTYMEFLSNADT